jgi:DNA-directed RNA polymerase beta subunit
MEDKLQSLDPHQVFKVTHSYTLDEIKQKYRRFAIKLHPDKNSDPRAAQLFQAISFCYQQLLEEYCARMSDKQYHDLKKESEEFRETQRERQAPPPQQQKKSRKAGSSTSGQKARGGKFDLEKFNQVFTDNKLEDVLDEGYGDWMQKNPAEEMTQQKIREQMQLSVSKPNASHTMDPTHAFELGMTRIDDFSKMCTIDMSKKNRGIDYTDYRVAHTTNKLIDENTPFRQYDSIDHLEAERAKVTHNMTPDEYAEHLMEKKREEEYEIQRVALQKAYDERMFTQYNKINNMLMGSGKSSKR